MCESSATAGLPGASNRNRSPGFSSGAPVAYSQRFVLPLEPPIDSLWRRPCGGAAATCCTRDNVIPYESAAGD